MGPNPFIGVIFHWIGGFASATNFIPFRGIKRWSWEIYWLIQGFAAWIVAPVVLAWLLVPNVFGILHTAYAQDPSSVYYPILWGILWGAGGLTFGLAIRYLGIALGYAIALGLCAAFGTIVPPIFHGEFLTILHQTSGQIILLGVLVCILGVAINGAAGVSKEHEITPEEKAEAGETDYNFGKGLAVAIFAGIAIGIFTGRQPHRRSWVVLSIIASNALVWTVVLALPHRAPLWLLVVLVVIISIGGPGSMVGMDFARTFNPSATLGSAQGMVNMGGYLASLFVMQAVGVILGVAGGYSFESFRLAWTVQYVIWIVTVVGILITRKKARALMKAEQERSLLETFEAS